MRICFIQSTTSPLPLDFCNPCLESRATRSPLGSAPRTYEPVFLNFDAPVIHSRARHNSLIGPPEKCDIEKCDKKIARSRDLPPAGLLETPKTTLEAVVSLDRTSQPIQLSGAFSLLYCFRSRLGTIPDSGKWPHAVDSMVLLELQPAQEGWHIQVPLGLLSRTSEQRFASLCARLCSRVRFGREIGGVITRNGLIF